MANVFGVGRGRSGRNHLAQRELDGRAAGLDGDLHGLRNQVAGRDVPVLALALVHVQLHRFSVGAVEGFVAVEHGLDRVLASGNLPEAADGVAPGARVHHGRLTRPPAVHRQAEDDLRAHRVVDLVARLVRGVSREQQQQPSVQRLGADLPGKADGERLGAGGDGKQSHGKRGNRK